MGGGARSTTARYHLFKRRQASRWRGGYDPSSVSTSLPASSARFHLSPLRLDAMVHTNLRMRAWYFAGSRRAETLLSTSLHMAFKIHTFYLASCAWGFGTALRRAAKIPSSLVRAVGGRRRIRLRPPRYFVCYLRGELRRNPRTM